jgi:tetratricopeptide (TPR) repeat protein
LELGRVQRIQSRGTFDLNVYERIQLAEDARRNYNRESADLIVDNLEAVLTAQPDNGVAHALLAMQYSQNLVSRWCDDPAQTRRQAVVHLQEAMRLAPNDSRVLMAAGIAALMRGQHHEAMNHLQRSLAKNPNEPHTLAEYGTARFYVTRELAPSIAMMQQAEQAAPQHPRYSIWAYRRGICYYEAGVYNEAIDAFDAAIARTPNYHHTYLTKALALVKMGEHTDAAAAIQQGIRYAPGLACGDYLSGVQSFKLTISEGQIAAFTQLWEGLSTL